MLFFLQTEIANMKINKHYKSIGPTFIATKNNFVVMSTIPKMARRWMAWIFNCNEIALTRHSHKKIMMGGGERM